MLAPPHQYLLPAQKHLEVCIQSLALESFVFSIFKWHSNMLECWDGWVCIVIRLGPDGCGSILGRTGAPQCPYRLWNPNWSKVKWLGHGKKLKTFRSYKINCVTLWKVTRTCQLLGLCCWWKLLGGNIDMIKKMKFWLMLVRRFLRVKGKQHVRLTVSLQSVSWLSRRCRSHNRSQPSFKEVYLVINEEKSMSWYLISRMNGRIMSEIVNRSFEFVAWFR
jgi:hypothetical protein